MVNIYLLTLGLWVLFILSKLYDLVLLKLLPSAALQLKVNLTLYYIQLFAVLINDPSGKAILQKNVYPLPFVIGATFDIYYPLSFGILMN